MHLSNIYGQSVISVWAAQIPMLKLGHVEGPSDSLGRAYSF